MECITLPNTLIFALRCKRACECVPMGSNVFVHKKFHLKYGAALALLGVHLLVLMVGTQMPEAWRSNVQQSLHAPSWLSSFAHFLLFAGMALLLAARPLAWPAARIVLVLLGLALLSEGLQFLTADRHPRWLDVGIDMAGVLVGLGLISGVVVCRVRR